MVRMTIKRVFQLKYTLRQLKLLCEKLVVVVCFPRAKQKESCYKEKETHGKYKYVHKEVRVGEGENLQARNQNCH